MQRCTSRSWLKLAGGQNFFFGGTRDEVTVTQSGAAVYGGCQGYCRTGVEQMSTVALSVSPRRGSRSHTQVFCTTLSMSFVEHSAHVSYAFFVSSAFFSYRYLFVRRQ